MGALELALGVCVNMLVSSTPVMSDNWICIIPRDPNFVPSAEAISEAERYLAEIAPDAEEVSSELADTVKFRDCGSILMRICCRTCTAELSTEWWQEQMGDEDYWQDGFTLHPIPLPCGHVARSLNDLHYDFDQGFSRFILEAMNPNAGALLPSEILHFEAILGCPIKVIYQRL